MKGFVLFLEALLAFFLLVVFLIQFFLPVPNTVSIASFVHKNDLFTAELESGFVSSFSPYVPGESCLSIRYAPVITSTSVLIVPYCIR